MSKVVIGMSMSLDGIAADHSEEDFWTIHEAVLGWVFGLRSWQAAQGMGGGEDTGADQVSRKGATAEGASGSGRDAADLGWLVAVR